jgi:hypothetical protein
MVALETTTFIQPQLPFAPRIQEKVAEMSRLINAALVDKTFCSSLLFTPALAIKDGYNGEIFHLSSAEQDFVMSVRAQSLTDFAQRWTKYSRDLISTAEFLDSMLPNRKMDC